MAFKTMTVDDLARIAAGGGFRIDGAYRSTDDLARIASAAARSGAQVTISGLPARNVDELARLGAAGKACVVLED